MWVQTLVYLDARKPAEDDQIMFAKKFFFDSKRTGLDVGSVGISGTLTGADLAYPNNTYAVGCTKEYKACFVTSVEQIGHNQIGRIQDPYSYPIVKWDDYEVIAQEESRPIGCYRVTITIDRRSEAHCCTARWRERLQRGAAVFLRKDASGMPHGTKISLAAQKKMRTR